MKQKQKRKNTGLIAALVVIILLLTGLIAVMLFGMNRVQPEAPAETAAPVETTAAPVETTVPETTAAPTETTVPETQPTETEPPETVPPETEPKVMLEEYAAKYEQNPELYGWIRIDGTRIDYPLMRSPEEPDKYLHADFYGDYLYAGTPYVDYKCSYDTDNMLIYGHNMLDGSMFRSLMNYENKSYWEKHPTIYLSDLYEEYEYEIVAAFRDRIYFKTDTCFKFYQFIEAENEADFDYAIEQFKEKAAYDTGVEATYGDHLITLITCAYHTENGRFVVVARRK